MHLTRLTVLATVVGAAVILGCGEGRLIVNVDVLSFLNTADDTVHYPPIPPANVIQIPGISFQLPPGIGSKTSVDTAALTVGASVVNAAGTGKVKFEIFFSDDSSSLYTTARRYAADSANVTGADSVRLTPPPIPVIGDTSFTSAKVFLGVRLTTGAGMTGRFRLSTLRLRIVLDDHFFTSSP